MKRITRTCIALFAVFLMATPLTALEHPSSLAYESWITASGITGVDADFDADANLDSVPNGFAFYHGAPDANTNAVYLNPVLSVSPGGSLVLSYDRADVASGIDSRIHYNTGLASSNWTWLAMDDPSVSVATSDNGATDRLDVTVDQDVLAPGTNRLFFTMYATQRPAPSESYELLHADNFNYLNGEVWSKGLEDDTPGSNKHIVWHPQQGGPGLLNNNYAGYITDEDVYIQDGALYLRNQERTYVGTDPLGTFDYTTGWVNSMGKFTINGTDKPVYVELRAKFPVGTDVWPAIWMVSDDPGWPPEIDIWEYFGRFFTYTSTDRMRLNYIWGTVQNKSSAPEDINNFDNLYDISQWHTYGWEWTADTMRWYLDGILIHTLTKEVDVPSADWPDEEFCFILNNGVMSVNAGAGAVYPNYLVIDYLDVWQESESFPEPEPDVVTTWNIGGTQIVKSWTQVGGLYVANEMVERSEFDLLAQNPPSGYVLNTSAGNWSTTAGDVLAWCNALNAKAGRIPPHVMDGSGQIITDVNQVNTFSINAGAVTASDGYRLVTVGEFSTIGLTIGLAYDGPGSTYNTLSGVTGWTWLASDANPFWPFADDSEVKIYLMTPQMPTDF